MITLKSLFFALLGVLLVSIFPAYATKVLNLSGAVKGYLPVVPVFLIVVLSALWNRTAGRWQDRLALSAKELAVVFCLMLFVAWIPSIQSELVRTMILPRYEEMTGNAPWRDAGVTTRLPDSLWPAAVDGDTIGEKVHFGFIQGGLEPANAPLSVWVEPLLRWMPLLIVLSIALMALTFLVHRQWTRHEQLRYPLASVAGALIRQDPDTPGGSLYRNKLFWWGFCFVFCYHLFRYIQAWFPAQLPLLPIEGTLMWQELIPIMEADRSNAAYFLIHWMPISFTIIGIAFFVPTDVSLSVGLTAPLGTILGIQYYLATGNPVSSSDLEIFRAGGFIAMGGILAYTGRTYYFPLLRKALWPGAGGASADPGGVSAARFFLAGYVGLVLIVWQMGMDWFAALLTVTFVLLIFLVVTRLVCETGIPVIPPSWSLPNLMVGLFGPAALGATPLVFMSLLSSVIVASNSTTLAMPYMATGLKVLDDQNANLRRFVPAAKTAILIALVISVVSILILSYSAGESQMAHGTRTNIDAAVREVLNLKDTGRLAASESAHGVGKLLLVRPDGHTIGMVMAGLVAVTATYLLRFRFAKWPLHPLFFIMLGAWVSRMLWFCFLLGWVIKMLVIKLGGGRSYRKLQPLFIGFILGELLVLALMFCVGLVYHRLTGNNPVSIYMIP